MIGVRSTPLLLALLAGSACEVEGDAGAFASTQAGSGSATDATTGRSTSGVATSTDSSTGPVDPVLDVGSNDVPSVECDSIQQSTDIEQFPSDVIIIGDSGSDQTQLQDHVTNLLPGLTTAGVFDTRVILIAGPAPEATPDDRFHCGQWACRGAQGYPYYRFIERTVPPGGVLTELMASEDAWMEHMRPDSWKHVWVEASTGNDADLTISEFKAAFTGLGVSFERFTFHTIVPEDIALQPGDNFAELAQQTGGQYEFSDFGAYQDGVLQSLEVNALACEYPIPDPPQGQIFDKTKINVDYDGGSGLATVGFVESVADCAGFDDGWYFDDPIDPSAILMCPSTCARFDALLDASIEIRFGCATTPAG